MTGSYDPDLYDVITPDDFRGDVEWYRSKARLTGGPVLELGAGTGRITLAIAGDGIEVHALDSHAGMREALARKCAALPPETQKLVTIAPGDMGAFDLAQRFALVIAPFRAFLHNLTTETQLACLRRVHRHLQPGGAFAFNVFHPSLEFMSHHAGALAGVWRWRTTHALQNGGQVLRSEANRYDTVRRVVHSQHRYEVYDAAGDLERTFLHSLELAYLYPADIERLLADTGFVDTRIYGDFSERPLSRDQDELVVEARRGS
jgi:SAM-dependent methyltransferase